MKKGLTEKITSEIRMPKECPNIILAIAPCRSGTSALIRVFAQAGFPSWFQPVKGILRSLIENKKPNIFEIPKKKTIFIKETIGPYINEESVLNPLNILIKAGVPSSKISLIIMMREPVACISSWIERFSYKTTIEDLVDNAIIAYKTVGKISEQAEKLNIHFTAFVYEVLRDYNSETVVSKLFDRLQIPFSKKVVMNWDKLSGIGGSSSLIVFPPETQDHINKGVYKKINGSKEFQYFSKSIKVIHENLTKQNIKKIYNNHITEIYKKILNQCEKDLGLKIKKDGVCNSSGKI